MSVLEAIFLAVVQGITEFLPISSSGHLAFFENLMRGGSAFSSMDSLKEASREELVFNVFIHMGTVFSLLVFFYKDLTEIIFGWLKEVRSLTPKIYSRFVYVTAITTVITAAIGLILKNFIHIFYIRLDLLAILFFLMGCILFFTRFCYEGGLKLDLISFFKSDKNEKEEVDISTRANADKLVKTRVQQKISQFTSGLDMFHISTKFAVIIGIVQGMAVLPGISRSGITLVTSLFLGIRYTQAVKYIMIISIPVIMGAFVLEARVVFGDNFGGHLEIYLIAMVVAFFTGLLSLFGLSFLVSAKKVHIFSYYLFFFASVVYSFSR